MNDENRLPKTEVAEKAQRRKFSAKYKARILKEIDEAEPGQAAAILRREGLYSSALSKWRAEREQRGLAERKRGPAANPLSRENKKLMAENLRLEKKLRQANAIIDLQKKIAEILGTDIQQSSEGS